MASQDFISLGNELKPELDANLEEVGIHFISLGNELKPELDNRKPHRP